MPNKPLPPPVQAGRNQTRSELIFLLASVISAAILILGIISIGGTITPDNEVPPTKETTTTTGGAPHG